MPTGDVVHLRMRGTLHGHQWMSGVHIQYKTGTATAQGLASHWLSNMMPTLLPVTCSEVQYNDIIVEAKFPAVLETYTLGYGPNTVGQLTGEAPPGQLAAAVDLRTGQKGGRRRGRQMLPAGAMAHILDGRYTSTSLQGLDAYAASLLTNYGLTGSTPDYQLVVFSPEKITNLHPGEKPRPGNLVTPVTTTIARPIVRTLRRRAIGQGV